MVLCPRTTVNLGAVGAPSLLHVCYIARKGENLPVFPGTWNQNGPATVVLIAPRPATRGRSKARESPLPPMGVPL